VWITAQVPEIFHEYKHMVEFFIEKRLPVRRVENRKSAGGRGCSINHFENHTTAVCGVGGFIDQRRAVSARERDARGLRELIDKLGCLQAAVCRDKIRPSDEVIN